MKYKIHDEENVFVHIILKFSIDVHPTIIIKSYELIYSHIKTPAHRNCIFFF